ncbi:membrane protein insertase YidC [Bacillus suaedaesalsae]|uniref:Membrane protein insertase YidC n=1 Tax=Bacillus suaedaesalsae TaxID=2810349 RepID=A0ABS2DH83_9BACI|nr:membrane protein insertase YidC [Bacillus suaedaesalsae]MBM6617842.1 membrane protein insertase YidC [Bacillus suaedaesalsae]
MEKKAAFISSKLVFVLVGISLLALLSGCGLNTEAITNETPGFFNHYFVYSFSFLLTTIANLFQGNYGLSIILVTLLIRLGLMPLMLKQSKSQLVMKDQMAVVQPEVKEIQEKMKEAKDAETKQKLQQEMMAVYQKHGVNPLASLGGCLPMVIQLPILMGFYYAILRTPEIATHSFLWFNLGEADILMAIIAAVVYLVQFKISLIGMDDAQKKQMALLCYLSPIMMGIFSLTAPAAMPLYWVVGGLFLILQTLLSKKLYVKKKAEAVIEAK